MTSPTSALDDALQAAITRLGAQPLSTIHWQRQLAGGGWQTAVTRVLDDDMTVQQLAILSPDRQLPRGGLLIWTAQRALLVRDPTSAEPVALTASRQELLDGRWKPLVHVEHARLLGTLVELLSEHDRAALAGWLSDDDALEPPPATRDAGAHDDGIGHWHETLSVHEPADPSEDVVDAGTTSQSGLRDALAAAELRTAHWWIPELLAELDGHPVTSVVDGSHGLVALSDDRAVCVEVGEREVWLATFPAGSMSANVRGGSQWPAVTVDDGADAIVDLGEVDQSAAETLQVWASASPAEGASVRTRATQRAVEPVARPEVSTAPEAESQDTEDGERVELGREDIRTSDVWRSSELDVDAALKPAVIREVLSHLDDDEQLERIVATDDAQTIVFATGERLVTVEERTRVDALTRPVNDVVLARDARRKRQVVLVSDDGGHRVHLQRLDRDTAEWLARWAHSAP